MSGLVALVAVVAAAASVVGAAWAKRPAPRRVAALVRVEARRHRLASGRRARRRRLLTRAALGTAAVAVAVLGGLPALVATVVAIAGWRHLHRRRAARRRQQEIEAALPTAVDLVALAVRAGRNVHQAVATAARAAPDPPGAAFAEVQHRLERGVPLADALAALTDRLGPAGRPLATVLESAGRDGVAIGSTLDQLAQEARRRRRLAADVAARQLPVRLSFPLVLCVLPAFALLTLAPLLAGALSSLHL